MAGTIEELKAENAAQAAELAKLRDEIEQLRHNVEAYRRMAFGPSSEKRKGATPEETDSQQGWLFHQTIVAEAFETAERKDIDATISYEAPKKPKPRGGRRKTFPEHTPEMTTRYELPEAQRVCACGSPLHEMGFETSRELERIEITFVHKIERAKYACRSCEEGVRTAPGPDRPFEKGLLGRGFLGHLIVERFGHHMPYHRLEKKFAGEGLEVSRSTQERSMTRCAERLAPLYDLLCEQVRSTDVLFTDDTPVTIAQPRGGGGSKQGRVWIYLDREGRHAYDFTESRSQDGPLKWLTGFKGYMHADAYPGYDKAFVPDGAIEVACWAHTRRKFIEAESSEPDLAAEILSRIRDLYAIERTAKDAGMGDGERGGLRQEKAMPILESLRARLAVLEGRALPRSPMGKAVGYAQRQWAALCTYVTDGRLEIDNNAAERALRGFAVGRKNWMFFQREGGGRTAAILASLLRTAQAAGVEPVTYFRDVLVRIDRERDWEKLLPHAWKERFEGEVEGWRQKAVERISGR